MAKPALYKLISVLNLIICCGISPEFIQSAPVYATVFHYYPPDKQLLLNGRIWRNQYSKAINDQFFLSNSFLKGSVFFNGHQFNDLDLMYDINNDELILRVDSYPVIILNKEMVDSFNLVFGNRIYHVINAGIDSANVLKGYVNVLYDGPTALFVKYKKTFHPMADDGRYDIFFSDHSLYLRKGTEIVPVTRKRKFLMLLEDKKKEIRHYLRSSSLKPKQKDPETFIPILRYYDSLKD
jgi:hypothetical protein